MCPVLKKLHSELAMSLNQAFNYPDLEQDVRLVIMYFYMLQKSYMRQSKCQLKSAPYFKYY